MSNEILRVERLAMGSVGVNANVIFDSVVVNSSGITYNSATGIITLRTPGRYECSFWVATQTSPAVEGAVFGLVPSQGAVLRGNSPVKMGEVTGGGVIDVATTPVTVALRNLSSAEYALSTAVPAKAILSIHSGPGLAAYGGLYSNSLPELTLLAGVEVQIPLTDPMTFLGVTTAVSTMEVMATGVYHITAMLIIQSAGIILDAGVRINGDFSEPSLVATYNVGGEDRVILLESIVVLQQNDILDLAVVSTTSSSIVFGPGRDASLSVFRLS